MSDSARAVFLSYAREDTAVAKRVADALRAFGVEVWFDQSELRGGDTWDQMIRGQIKTCALFMPIVSANTEERTEGYFRREWKIAVDRTADMAGSRSFIVPVVIDETSEGDAAVPEEFMRYQWTRLVGGEVTPEFVTQVKRLLAPPKKPGSPTRAAPGPVAATVGSEHAASRPASGSRAPLVLGAVAFIALAAGAAFFALRRPAAVPAAATPGPAIAQPAAAPVPIPATDKSVAVLPFTNMSEDKDANAFFSDGIHEDILTNLAFIRDLRVVSRTSVMQYRGTTKPISQIAAELKVTYVLEGSVRRAGSKVRVTGQLIRAANDEHVWAQAYDRDISDVFSIQAELSKAIAGALQAVLSPETKALLERRPTDNPAAYDAYLRARQMSNSSGYAGARDMAALLRRAVELDPNFSAAWAELGAREAFVFFKTIQTPEQLAKAKAAIDRAVQLAPEDPAVVEGLGDYYYYGHRDYARATEQYLRLAQLRPNDATVFASLARIQRRQGRMGDALPNFRRAADLDPQTSVFESDYVGSLFGCRKYAETISRGRKFLQTHPDDISMGSVVLLAEFAAGGTTAGVRSLAGLSVPPSQHAEHLYVQLVNARATADWAEAIRLERELHYFDGDDDNPRFLQDVIAATTLAEAGDRAAARARAAAALTTMNALLAEQPLNAQLWAGLSLAHGMLGARDDAMRCAAKARELLPESRDAMSGAAISALCASALAYAGEKDRALAEFERLLRVPFGTNPVLERGIATGSWEPLRDDPRFQALLNDPKNNQPLF